MEKIKHSPGPWLVDEETTIRSVFHLRIADLYFDSPANARLIAAAPELLEACKAADEIAADLDCFSTVSPAGRKAKDHGIKLHRLLEAAIAKAEGAQ